MTSLSLLTDDIAAIATPRGQGAIAIIRVSGPNAWAIAQRMVLIKPRVPKPGRAYVGWAVDPADPDVALDEALLLLFAAPRSATGEDIAEIHCHGGDYLASRILDGCLRAGARLAERGEFSKRAFLNGRLDLSQAESVLDLIQARGDRMLSAACRNLKTRALAQAVEALMAPLVSVQAELTACVDFPDEVEEPDREALIARLGAAREQAQKVFNGAQRARLIRDGLTVAILGLPNAGKSSLFNALLARERAIVTPTPGATRDALRESVLIDGLLATLVDTAGIRDSDDPVETIGVARSWQAAEEAHAALYLYDAAIGLKADDNAILERLRQAGLPTRVIASQCDRLTPEELAALPALHLAASSLSGQGLEAAFHWIAQQGRELCGESEQGVLALNARQQVCLQRSLEALAEAIQALESPRLPIDLANAPLAEALRELDALLGRDATQAVLDETFSRFCVGK